MQPFMAKQYQRMLETERLILSRERQRKYFGPVITAVLIAVLLTGLYIFALTKVQEPFPWVLIMAFPPLVVWYSYHHQSSALRFKKIITESNKRINHERAKAALDELGWAITVDNGNYIEALVPFLGAVTPSSQLVVVLSADQKVLVASISQPDYSPVQGGLSFGKNKRNVKCFTDMFLDIQDNAAEQQQ